MLEYRAGGQVEAEIAADDSFLKLYGYAAMFNVLSEPCCHPRINGGRPFRERVLPGAFAKSLASRNVSLVAQHRRDAVLANTMSGTLTLAEDAVGLRFSAEFPPTTLSRDIYVMVRARILPGMSFGFLPVVDRMVARDERDLVEVLLDEISTVEQGAYSQAFAEARSLAVAADRRRTILRLRMA